MSNSTDTDTQTLLTAARSMAVHITHDRVDEAKELAETILAKMPITMDDVEWDDDLHHMTMAHRIRGVRGDNSTIADKHPPTTIMLYESPYDAESIVCTDGIYYRENLIPTETRAAVRYLPHNQ